MANLKVKATLDKTEYERGIDQMKKASKDLNHSFGEVGGIVAGVFGGNMITGAISGALDKMMDLIGHAKEEAASLGRASENIGIKPTELDEIQNVFERFGQSGDEVVSMFGRLAAARDKLLDGNPKAIKDFRDLGLSMQQVKDMDPKKLFDAVSAAYAKAGGMGDVGIAAGDIFGKGMRNVGNQRSMLAYGSGKRFDRAFEPTNEEAVAAQLQQVNQKRAAAAAGTLLHRLGMHFIPAYAVAQTATMPTPKQTQKELAEREAANDLRTKQSNDAAERAKAAAAKMTADIDAENERYLKDMMKEKEIEIREGARLEHPATDAYRRRGLIAGNAASAGDNMTYAIARKQVALTEQLVELNRRMAADLHIANTHRDNMKIIENKYAPKDTPPTDGGGVK